METLTVCRFCLIDNVQHVVKDLELQEIYERLTRLPFQTDMRPLAVCYICYAQLRASLRFKLKCLQAEQLLARMLDDQPALNPTQIDRSAFDQLSVSSFELANIESTDHGVRTSDTDKLNTYECYVKLERLTITDLAVTSGTTHWKPANEQNPSDLEDNVPLNYVKELTETKETRVVEQQQDRLMTVQPETNTDDAELEANQRNDDFENYKIKMITEQDYITCDTCPQNVCEHYSNNIKYNDNAIHVSLNGDNSYLSSVNIFICDKCENSFSKHNDLVKHITRNCDKSHMCPVCDKGFTERNLKIHARTHTDEKPHVCNVCEKGFIRKSYLKRHKLTHTSEKPYVCNVCQKGFIYKDVLKIHKFTHTDEKPHVCNVCQKGFIRKTSLKIHELKHIGEKPHVGNVCVKSFIQKADLKIHELKHEDLTDTGRTTHSKPASEQNPIDLEDNAKPLNYVNELRETKETSDTKQQQDSLMTVRPKTDECESNPVNYKQDVINVTNTDDVEFEANQRNDDFENYKIKMITEQDFITRDTCPQNVCERYSNNIKYNDNGINESLNGDNSYLSSEKIFICDKCKNSFSKKNELVKHIMRNCKSHMCPVCDKGFTKRYLKTHIFTHTREKPHVCNVCQKGYIQKTSLKKHELKHTGKKPHVYNMCSKGFIKTSYLKQHELKHTGKKPHVYNMCPKGFIKTSYLKQHELTHTVEKPHVCNVCKKGFTQKACLKKHKLTHTGVKPHVCNVCQKGFYQKTVLKIHELTHTGEKPHVCDVCQKAFNQKSNLKRHKLTHR